MSRGPSRIGAEDGAALVLALGLGVLAPAAPGAALTPAQKRAIRAVGRDAYIYGYAPVAFDRVVARFPSDARVNVRYIANAGTRTIVRPNVDTLYTIAVLSLGSDPVIVETPPTGARYFSLQLIDAYTNVFGYIGSRATGTGGGTFAIAGPGWNETTTPLGRPVDAVFRAPTPRVWVLGRTRIDGPDELGTVRAIQDAVRFQRNSRVGSGTYLRCIDSVLGGAGTGPGCLALPAGAGTVPATLPTPTADFFRDLGRALRSQPPVAADAPLIARMRRHGIGPGLDPARTAARSVLALLVRGAVAGEAAISARLAEERASSIAVRDGWILFDTVGAYGTDYLLRAVIARFGICANTPAEAIYPAAVTDSDGAALSGAGGAAYRVRFAGGAVPPTIDGCWSITLYGPDGYLVGNTLGRFSVGSSTPGLVTGKDGTLDIWVSATQPSAERGGAANWLPAPAGPFSLILRVYRPAVPVRDGTWPYPRIVRVD
ncbi:MAG: DUF1254 domain-containing protein [Chloroflexota bacterium]